MLGEIKNSPRGLLAGRFITAAAGSYPEPPLTPGFPSGIPYMSDITTTCTLGINTTIPPLFTTHRCVPTAHAVPCCHLVSACLYELTRVPGPPIGWPVSVAQPRLTWSPADVVACRAYRDPRVPTLFSPKGTVVNENQTLADRQRPKD